MALRYTLFDLIPREHTELRANLIRANIRFERHHFKRFDGLNDYEIAEMYKDHWPYGKMVWPSPIRIVALDHTVRAYFLLRPSAAAKRRAKIESNRPLLETEVEEDLHMCLGDLEGNEKEREILTLSPPIEGRGRITCADVFYETRIAELERQVAQLQQESKNSEKKRDEIIKTQDETIEARNEIIKAKDKTIKGLQEVIGEKDQTILRLVSEQQRALQRS